MSVENIIERIKNNNIFYLYKDNYYIIKFNNDIFYFEEKNVKYKIKDIKSFIERKLWNEYIGTFSIEKFNSFIQNN